MTSRRLLPLIATVLMAAVTAHASEIEGLVRPATPGRTITSATVQLRRQGQASILVEVWVGASGHFEFRSLGLGAYTIHVRAPGFLDREETILIMRDNSREVIQIELQPQQASTPNSTGVVSVFDLKIPDSAKREYEQGLKERNKGGCAKALPHFEKAISTFANYADALNEVGKCYQSAGKIDRSEDSFRKAIQYGSTIFPYINLADLLVSAKHFEESQIVLRAGLEKFPKEGDLYFALSNSLFAEGRLNEAEHAALDAHSRFHASPEVHLVLAKIYASLGKHPQVISQLKTYLEENPKGPMADRVRQNLAQIEPK